MTNPPNSVPHPESSTPQHSGHRLRRLVFIVLAMAAVLLVCLVTYLRRFRFPAPTGPYPVGTTVFDLTEAAHDPYSADPAARRELVVQLWYPAKPSRAPLARYMRWSETRPVTLYAPLLDTHSRMDAPVAQAADPFPVLLFSHRWSGQRTQNTVLAEDLASHGYVVASIDRPHNAARTELADGTVVRGHEDLRGLKGDAATVGDRIGFWNKTLQLWAADERFVLDGLERKTADAADPFHSRLDTVHAGAFGHSFGGAAALALCGSDPRIRACANLDGWTFGGLRDRTAAQSVLLFFEGSSRNRERQIGKLPRPGSAEDQLERADNAAIEASLRAFGGDRLFLTGSQHLDFSDEPLLPPLHRPGYTGPTAPAEVNAILRETLLQFFDRALRGRSAPVLSPGQPRFPELTVETWPYPGAASASPHR